MSTEPTQPHAPPHEHTAPLWTTQPQVLLDVRGVESLFPAQASLRSTASLNAIVRGALLVAVVGRVLGASAYILLVPVVAMLATYCVHVRRAEGFANFTGASLFDDAVQHNKHPNVADALQHEYPPSPHSRANTTGSLSGPVSPTERVRCGCLPPTQSNPFGNVMIPEMQKPRRRACSRQDQPFHAQHVNRAFQSTQNVSQSDVFSTHASQRQFFTMPWTTVPNDTRGDFANWLYDTPPILKEQALVFSPV